MVPGGGQVDIEANSQPKMGSVGTGWEWFWTPARGGGAAALTAGFRPSEGADNGVAVPGAPSPGSPVPARPLSPKLLSI